MNRRLLKMLLLAALSLVPQVVVASVDTAWVRRWDGAAHQDDWAEAMALDSQNNVYVTGVTETDTVNGHYDIITLKYSPSGELLWERQYGSPGTLERPYSMTVDRDGNAYIGAVQSDIWTVLKYNSAGTLTWVRHFGGGWCKDISLDSRGNVPTCGQTIRATPDFTTVEYLPNGDTAWARFYEYPDDYDFAWALAVSPQNEVCVAGQCTDSNPGGNYLVIKYDSVGRQSWVARYDGPQHGADWVTAVAVDSSGNVVATGSGDNGYGTPFDYLTVKYNSAGETLWVRRYNGTANGRDEASAVVVDAQGNTYVTGHARYQDTDDDFATIKYQPDGSTEWLARYDGPAHSGDGAYAMAITDDGGSVYVTGSSWGGSQALADCATVCYDSSGDTVWVRRYNSSSNWAEYTTTVALDRSGAVYVAGIGYSAGSTSSDILTIKYSERGAVSEVLSPPATLPPLRVAPNPFRSRTTISFSSAPAHGQRVVVCDASGRRVRVLVLEEELTRGGVVCWDGLDELGRRVPAGVYTIVLEARQVVTRVKVLKLE